MLYIHTSNHLERLSQQFSAVVNTPLDQVFSSEMVVVQNAGMARYLSMQQATISGISANTEFLFPAEFMWRLLRLVSPDIPEKNQCTPETLRFHIMEELCEHAEDYPELQHYISPQDTQIVNETSTWNLACEFADMFDKILFYRSNWIQSWEEEPEKESIKNWQARLWIRCVKNKNLQHWLHLQKQFKTDVASFDSQLLPERVSFFSMSSLSPGYLELMGEVALKTDIHIYIINPCENVYWGDIISEKSRSKLSTEKQTIVDTGNALLASMGAQGRDFIDQLLNLSESSESFQRNSIAPFEDQVDKVKTVLSVIQQDIYTLSEPQSLLQKGIKRGMCASLLQVQDKSITFNACHTVMREVEVLHDQILDALDSDSSLTPADIVVMMPDVEKYAPYIESIFASEINTASGKNNTRNRLPFSIADRDPLNVHQLIEALLKILTLPETHYDVESVFEILDYKAVHSAFNLDEDQVNRCRQLARASNIRWGIDAASRSRDNFPKTNEHTWKTALDRILLGYALGENSVEEKNEDQSSHCQTLFAFNNTHGDYHNLLPFNEIEGNNAIMLADLKNFTDTLFKTSQWPDQKHLLSLWLDKIAKLVSLIFTNNRVEETTDKDITLILKSINEIRDLIELTDFKTEISFNTFQSILQSSLQKISGHEKFLGHGITFCALVPMRSVPFKLVALMGMNDAEFPRQDKHHSFDLMAKEPRRGDRSRRDEDRYLFLESLLAARSRLIISYIGQSVKDNSDLPPSALVSELLDTICIYMESKPEDHICKHPLQAFSPRYFQAKHSSKNKDKKHLLFSYAKEYTELQTNPDKAPSSTFINKRVDELDNSFKSISLDDLIHFFQSPARSFLSLRFDIKTFEEEIILPIREPFQLESFKDQELREIVYQCERREERENEKELTISSVNQQIARAKGLLPYGEIGDAIYQKEEEIVEQFKLEHPILETISNTTISLELGEFTLHGKIKNQTNEQTRVIHQLSKHYARDAIRIWIEHLFFNTQTQGTTEYYSPENSFILDPVDNAKEQLSTLLKHYWSGLHYPLRFFPKSSYNMFKDHGECKLSKAKSSWDGNDLFSGEKNKFEHWLLYRDVTLETDDSASDDFLKISQQFFGEMYLSLREL